MTTRELHDRVEEVLGRDIIGIGATDGSLSVVVVDGDLSSQDYDSLSTEFGQIDVQ